MLGDLIGGVSYAWCAFGFLGFVVWLGLDCLGLVWCLGFGIAWWCCLGHLMQAWCGLLLSFCLGMVIWSRFGVYDVVAVW